MINLSNVTIQFSPEAFGQVKEIQVKNLFEMICMYQRDYETLEKLRQVVIDAKEMIETYQAEINYPGTIAAMRERQQADLEMAAMLNLKDAEKKAKQPEIVKSVLKLKVI